MNSLDNHGPAVFTNVLEVGLFETAKLAAYPFQARCNTTLKIEKDGDTLTALYDPFNINREVEPVVVAGPAKITLFCGNGAKGYCTFEILPTAYRPDKSLILPPVQIV